jgi:hypothetical protein
VSGSSDALTVGLSEGAAFVLDNETEVGAVKIEGQSSVKAGFENGLAVFEDGALNSEDGHAVELSHILFFGVGEVGALATKDAELEVGTGSEPAGYLEATSVKLDPGSEVGFEITGTGTEAAVDYSQLRSEGAVELGNSTIGVVVGAPEGKPCPVLVAGQTYTFVSTTGKLSGSFANAPEPGPDIPITFAKGCTAASQAMQISYQESGATQTVIGTVQIAPKVTKEPASVEVLEGGEATFEASASGVPTPTVQWERSTDGGASWSPVTGAT